MFIIFIYVIEDDPTAETYLDLPGSSFRGLIVSKSLC